jgi:hypothetical protein
VVKAEVVEAVLESSHTVVAGQSVEGEIRVVTEDRKSQILGLKVNGVKVDTKLSETLARYTRFGDLRDFLSQREIGGDKSLMPLRQSFCSMSLLEHPNEENVPDYVADLCRFQRDDLIRCTIFESITASKALDVHGYSIDVPKFGRLFLGELLVTRGQKRLNMIRFDLGCDTSGGGTGGGASVDGEPVP